MAEAKSFEEHRLLKVAQPVNPVTEQDIKNLAIKAALGSFFIIGLGQVYLGHKRRGIALFFMPFLIFIGSSLYCVAYCEFRAMMEAQILLVVFVRTL